MSQIFLSSKKPTGSKYLSNGAVGPNCHPDYGISGLKPCYLGTWNLRENAVLEKAQSERRRGHCCWMTRAGLLLSLSDIITL